MLSASASKMSTRKPPHVAVASSYVKSGSYVKGGMASTIVWPTQQSLRTPHEEEEVVAPTTDNGAPPPEFLFEVSLAGDEVRVELVATTRGAASSAFWRLAEELRNDVVRDTRKWRRRMASSARTD